MSNKSLPPSRRSPSGYGSTTRAGSQSTRRRSDTPNRTISPVSNFSRPGFGAQPAHHCHTPSCETSSALSTRPTCSVVYDNGTGVFTDDIKEEIRRKGKLPHNIESTPELAALLNKPLPVPHTPRTPQPRSRESFTLADVPSGRAQMGRAAHVKSMMAVHSSDSSTRTSQFRGPQHLCNNFETTFASNDTRRQQNSSTHAATANQDDSPHKFNSPRVKEVSRWSPDTPQFPPTEVIRAMRSGPDEPTSRNLWNIVSATHPSTALLLASRSPYVHHMMLDCPSLVLSLQDATLPILPATGKSTRPSPWYEGWPTTVQPLQRRTLSNLRTTNMEPEPYNGVAKGDSHQPRGQAMHFSRSYGFRWSKRTREHGPETDYAHPSFAGSVAASRSLWQASYRDLNSRIMAPVMSVAKGGRERRQSRWEGHWLRRGNLKDLRWRKEQTGCSVSEDAEAASLKERRRWVDEGRGKSWGKVQQIVRRGTDRIMGATREEK